MTISNRAKFGRVGLLYGGTSSEREVSLMSGGAVLNALQQLDIDVTAIDVQNDLLQILPSHNLDRVFIALHGPGGEDGTLQGALEHLGLPYTGSGVLASALAMDKLRCKQMWQGIGLSTADFAVLNAQSDWLAILRSLGGKVMVKPACEGSSIGMSRAETPTQLKRAWQQAAEFDMTVIAEPLLEGAEYTVAILGDQALPSIRIRTDEVFYDYQAKYFSDDTQYQCPSDLSPEREAEIRELSLDAFNSVGCTGWGRVDLMLDSSDRFQLLEVNTSPGMTSHSLVPMAAEVAGLNFDQLVLAILEDSL
ncbi:D-alanine--D-alanine ligase [SAR92 clade bacterium H921]|jgi:D-alanine-D-alanine ligase|nr:D-alanine--D-alanine ligase [SAR92 clade bacterium H921]MDA9687354.1 D-alanine--D-alanine ligase [bacterium]MDG0971761.1 D-alanine--D-alanine ligase [Porticoccaceae bacterium]MDG1308371.1 D-alanine--D-alanine ligase [Porticoccaceae bacterium]